MESYITSYITRCADIYKEILKNHKPAVLLFTAAAIKYFIFYTLMGVNSNFFVVLLTSLIFTGFIFGIFQRKWIAGAIYLLLSFVMFADVTYFGYFGRYLSFNMLGAAEVVGDIKECIEAVLRPVNFCCLLDAAGILGVLIYFEIRDRKEGKAESEKTREQREPGELIFKPLVMVLILTVIIGSSYFSSFAKSIRNQEFFSYHVYDALDCAFGGNKANLEAFEDSYKDEKDGPLFGVAEGRNLVFIQLESYMNFVIGREYNGQELTPNLNALINDNSIYCKNFYQQVGSGNTSDAEFAANNSIYGTVLSYTYKVYGEKNYFRGLPVLLKEKGYDTAVFHAYEDRTFWNREAAYPNLGFDKFFGGLTAKGGDYEMTEWMGWGLTDTEFFEQTVPLMKENLKEPYYAFVNTLSNHHPFKMLKHYQNIKVDRNLRGTLVGNYLQSVNYVDSAIGEFFDELKANGMYENSIFVIYGDHAGITHSPENDEAMKTLLGTDEYTDDVLLNVPCIIHIPNPKKDVTQVVTKACGQLDIMPTVAYLMGFKKLDTVYFGHNMLAEGTGFIPEQTFVKRGSFVLGDIMYSMSLDGVFEHGKAWEISSGRPVALDGLEEYYEKGMNMIQTCEYLLETDALRTIYLKGGKVDGTNDEKSREPFPGAVVKAGFPSSDLVGAQTLEALNTSYDAGYRYINLTMKWSKDGNEIYAVNANTGKRTLDGDDLIEWFKDHTDSRLVIDIDGEKYVSLDNTYTFFGNQGEDGTAFGRSILLLEKDTSDYTGRHDVFLDVSRGENAELGNETLAAFIENNKVWAIVIDEKDVKGKRKGLLNAGCGIYVSYADGRIEPYQREK